VKYSAAQSFFDADTSRKAREGKKAPVDREGKNLIKVGNLFLHPNYIVRVAGMKAGWAGIFDSRMAVESWLEKKNFKNNRLVETSGRLCAMLEDYVSRLGRKRDSVRLILTIRRNIFNLRKNKSIDLQNLKACISSEDHAAIVAFEQNLSKMASLDTRVSSAYENALQKTSQPLHESWQEQGLQYALSYANPALYDRLKSRFENQAALKLPKKARKQEDTLFQYIYRLTSKTSPLSRFTSVYVGCWSDETDTSMLVPYLKGEIASRVQYKMALMQFLLSPWLEDFDVAGIQLPLRLNNSIREQRNGRLKFRAISSGNLKSGRFFGTGESIAELTESAILRCIRNIYSHNQKEALVADELCAEICTLYPNLPAVSVMQFIRKLYETKILLPETGLHGQDDPLDWARNLLRQLSGTSVSRALNELGNIQSALTTFISALPDERAALVLKIEASTLTLAELTGAKPDAAMLRPLFFENCYHTQIEHELSPACLAKHADDFDILLKLAPLAGINDELRSHMADLFLAEYGEHGRCEDPVGFLERFDEIFHPGRMMPAITTDISRSTVTVALDAAKRALYDYLEIQLRKSEDIHLLPDDLIPILDLVPRAVYRRGASQSFLIQRHKEKGMQWLVLNQVFGGRSGLQSRFLEILTEPELERVRGYLRAGSRRRHVIEMPGVFGFNANSHPRLSDGELQLPPYPDNFDATSKYVISEMTLVYDSVTHTVCFQDRNGEKCDVWYQGFLVPGLMPQLQRILALTFSDGISHYLLGVLQARNFVKQDEILKVGRVVIGNVVISRKMWLMTHENLPDDRQNSQEFFYAVQEWREKFDLPDTAFMRMVPIPEADGDVEMPSGDEWHDFNFRDIKPFYVDFTCPRGVRLMQRAIKRNRYSVMFTELLPGFDELQGKVNNYAHVTELQFELTRPANAAIISERRWHTLCVPYFDESRDALMLGPIRDFIRSIENAGVTRIQLQAHWKRGPHVRISVFCDADFLHEHFFPMASKHIQRWLDKNPSQTDLKPDEYLKLSRKIALYELDPGPYAPLYENNKLTLMPYQGNRVIEVPEINEAMDGFMVQVREICLDLLMLRRNNTDDFFLTLLTIGALIAHTYYDGGLQRGYVSYRAHADYFFATIDEEREIRIRFNALGQRLGDRIDDSIRAVMANDLAATGLPETYVDILHKWSVLVSKTAGRILYIARQKRNALVKDYPFSELIQQTSAVGDPDEMKRARLRKITKISARFFNEEEGKKTLTSAEFAAYRICVNMFYQVLPVLSVAPIQKLGLK